MNANWEIKKLGDIITLQRGHDLPSQARKHGQIPIMGSSGITGYHNQFKAKGPGVIIGRSGNSMGQVSYVSENYWPLNTCLYVTDFKGNCPEFIYYFLKQINFEQFNSGSAQKSLNRNAVYPFEVKFPTSYKIQSAIASILFALENKIKLNQEINQTLEQMAQALFKSWFVDFEPVKAKITALEAGGSQEEATLAAMATISGKNADALEFFGLEHPGHYTELKATAELFPSAMQSSEMGAIPAGWRTDIVDSIVNRLKVKNTFPPDCIKQFGKHPVLEQGAKVYQGYHDEEPSFNASLQSPMFIFGDHTCVMHLSIVPFDISKNTLVLEGKGFNTYWTFFALKGKQKFQEYKRHWSDLKVKQVIIPDEANGLLLTNFFGSKCESLFGLLEQNRKQNMILQNIRDTLLPKLLSGEITLPEVEQAVSEVENV